MVDGTAQIMRPARAQPKQERRPSGCAEEEEERRNKTSRQTETETRTEKRDRSGGTNKGPNNKNERKQQGTPEYCFGHHEIMARCCHSTHMRFLCCYCYRIHALVQLYSVAYCFGVQVAGLGNASDPEIYTDRVVTCRNQPQMPSSEHRKP